MALQCYLRHIQARKVGVAGRYAAARDSTVNRLVRGQLTRLAACEDRAANARQEIRELSDESTARLSSIQPLLPGAGSSPAASVTIERTVGGAVSGDRSR